MPGLDANREGAVNGEASLVLEWGGLRTQACCFPTCQQVLPTLTLSRGRKVNMQKDF